MNYSLNSPEDRAALNQARELKRKKRVIRKAWLILAATVFVGSPRKFIKLVRDARFLLHKEAERDYYEAHPDKRPKAKQK